jgi:ribonuclease HII
MPKNLKLNNSELRIFELCQHPVAGVDEVGRGALFGEVVAAAVILPVASFDDLEKAGVTDSKKLSPKRRTELDRLIRDMAVDCQIGTATVAEIDNINILAASLLAMERAIAKLMPQPNHCLIDGNQRLRFQEISPVAQTTVVQGDKFSLSIAAASIVAKVWRDRALDDLARDYPEYDLAQNKGYGTAKHRAAILKFGRTALHRQSFKLK